VRVRFVVESGTDVRLVEGLAARCDLEVLARRIPGGVEISQPPGGPVAVRVGPASRARFALLVLRALLFGRRGDHVLVQGYGAAALAANLASRLTGTPTTMLVCSPVESYYRCRRDHAEPGKPFRAWELSLLLLLARLNARVGRQYVVLSEYLADTVRGHGTRRTARPVHVIPVYGVDTERFRPATESRAAVRARLGIPEGGPLIFFSSRVSPEKDAETLLDAVARLAAAGRDVRVLHRSGGWRDFLALARKRGIERRVIASDAVHPERELPLSYQASDLCVQASRDEGLGFSPLEALGCEVPVVATAVGGLRETIVDGETGWTYPVGDVAALAAAIADALDRPDEARRRAATGRAMVRERFERQAVFGRLFEALAASTTR
jgi:glycosyltransferase involved in cell wall biosynthesis